MNFSVQDLSCHRGEVTVLKGVTFDISAGEVLILRGPNGAGKTTLLRTIAHLTPKRAGSMSFGMDEVAYAAHADGLKAQLTVAENLTFWAHVYGAQDITPALEGFELSALQNRQTAYLSAGQKRRLSLSRLTLTGRPLWALDEPTVSLDTENVARFADAVRAHTGNGGCAIIATHIDLGLTQARTLDITPFRAISSQSSDPFLDENWI
ncbi:MAG: heme ABC exporter ATP-binding protein CcmA [Litoreibacter sp.]